MKHQMARQPWKFLSTSGASENGKLYTSSLLVNKQNWILHKSMLSLDPNSHVHKGVTLYKVKRKEDAGEEDSASKHRDVLCSHTLCTEVQIWRRCSFNVVDRSSLIVGRSFWVKGEFKWWRIQITEDAVYTDTHPESFGIWIVGGWFVTKMNGTGDQRRVTSLVKRWVNM